MTATVEIAQRQRGEEPPPQDARHVGAARHLVAAWLGYLLLSGMKDPVMLIVSELVTNAIVHGRGSQVTLTMQLEDGELYVAVDNDGPGKPALQHADDDAEHGRGLQLVEWCTVEQGGAWGISDGGSMVWCRLPAKGEGL
ncbi:ATP-binding protein (plasmid) [Streptomyces sp. NBC_00637]|jgi:anti-sigma regulatory factor (Ser/Thr protein kinase)|uniref:ATP-binding protein n=1 Tax=Streptomyces sp. NBC_00637 TaxID=2903667 RepID=UPI00324EBCE4